MSGQSNNDSSKETQDEINSLLQSLDEEAPASTEGEGGPKDISEFHGSSEEAPMEETLGSVKGESSRSGDVFDNAGESDSSQGGGTLSMTLTGNMTLVLKYDYEGQEVSIGFRDQALELKLSDGTEFKIPVRKSHLKVA